MATTQRRVRRVIAAAIVGAMGFPAATAAAPGEIDSRFGVGGIVITPTAPDAGPDFQNGMVVERDGRFVVAGESYMGTEGGWQWRVSRYTRHGRLDVSFGNAGTALVNMSSVGGFDERIISVAVQHDGKIVAGGFALNATGDQDSALARFNPDGTLDATFGNAGIVITDIVSAPDHDFINQVVIDASGNIVVAGGCRHFFVARFTPNGTLDPSFNGSSPRPGINITEASPGESSSEILGMAIDERGRIIGGGYSTGVGVGVNSAVVRYLPDGTLDTSFNPSGARPGVVVTPVAPGGGWDVVFRVAVDRQGRIVTAGDAFVGVGAGLYDIALTRYLEDGVLDTTFAVDGIAFINAGPADSDDDAQGLVIQPNGRILVGGSAAPTAFTVDSDFMVAAVRADGTLDTAFGQGGVVVSPTAPGDADDEIWAMALQGASKLVAAGECDQPGTGRDVCVVRYNVGG